MNECYGNHFVWNGVLHSSALFDNSLVYEGESVYEVLRVVKGIPVFFYDHVKRLETSTRLQGKQLLSDAEDLRYEIKQLISSGKKREINLKIVFNYNNGKTNRLVYYIQPVYPSSDQYENGVRGILFDAERKDPGSKVINHRLRSEIYHRLITENAYEALLVNKQKLITEGSRSNIFFIRNNRLITAPEEYILNGITRMHILEICRENGLEVELSCVPAASISDFDTVFMTGTSPIVLPFNRIGNVSFTVNHRLISLLRKLYLRKAKESIRNFADTAIK